MLKTKCPWTAALLVALPLSACDCGDSGLINAKANLVYEPDAIDFGKVPVNDQRIKSITFTNKGQVTLKIERFELVSETNEILFATPAPTQLVAEQRLDFNFAYEPKDVGIDTARLVIKADDQEAERTIEIQGEGVASGVGVTHEGPACGETAGSLSFGQVGPGQTVSKTITVRAAGTAPMTVLSAVLMPGTSAEFDIDDLPEPRVLQPGETLTLAARYTPSDGGADTGAFVITTDVPDQGTTTIQVCGESVAPAVCATPYPLNLGSVAQGGSASGVLNIESCGLLPLDISAIGLANDAVHTTAAGYAITTAPAVPRTLQPGESIQLPIDYTAGALGLADGWVRVDSNALNNTTAYFPVTARVAQPCDLLLVPTALSYTGVAVGATQQKQVLLANNGASNCTVSRLEISNGAAMFTLVTPNAPVTVPAGNSVTVVVEYSPSAAGVTDMGTLDVEESGVTRQVSLTGTPLPEDGCILDVSPQILNFGVVAPGQVRSIGLTLTNVTDEFCTLRGVSLGAGTDPAFVETSPSFGIILPNRSKTISVTYTPTVPGAATGTLVIETSDVVTGTFNVPLFASSAASNICVDPRVLAFGPTQVLATMTFNISACGGNPVQVTGLDWTLPDTEFSVAPAQALPFTLLPGQNRVVTVQYQPTDAQGDTGELMVRSDDLANPAIPVSVTGGPEVVPAEAGRFLYYWQIPNPISGGDIMRLPLQGVTTPSAWWGPRTGKACSGCHAVSPDGRYVAIIEASAFRIVDTTTDIALALPNGSGNPQFLSWNPDVNTNPPYQYVYDVATDLSVASLFQGVLYEVAGASDPAMAEMMPSWGSDGKIAYVRGMTAPNNNGGGSFGLAGPCDIMTIPVAGGTPTPLAGASNPTPGMGGAYYYPSYSPNGRWIAFTYSAQASSTIAAEDAVIRLARSDNSGQVMMLPSANNAPGNGATSYPTWSVNGAFLSFSSNRSGGQGDWDIYIAPVDPMTGVDGPATNVSTANSAAFEHAAIWSP